MISSPHLAHLTSSKAGKHDRTFFRNSCDSVSIHAEGVMICSDDDDDSALCSVAIVALHRRFSCCKVEIDSTKMAAKREKQKYTNIIISFKSMLCAR